MMTLCGPIRASPFCCFNRQKFLKIIFRLCNPKSTFGLVARSFAKEPILIFSFLKIAKGGIDLPNQKSRNL
jgi:hypothetical protein